MKNNLTVNTVEAKNSLNALLSEVNETKRAVIIEKRGQAVAVILDFEEYQNRIQTEENKSKATDLISRIQALHKEINKDVSHKKKSNSADLINKIRKERACDEKYLR